jgi:hypothetical protein
MDYDFKVNEKLSIGHIGKWFVISGRNNINGRIEFSDNFGNMYSVRLRKNDRNEFNIEDLRKNGIIKFVPSFVEFFTEEEIETITIAVAPVNPQTK